MKIIIYLILILGFFSFALHRFAINQEIQTSVLSVGASEPFPKPLADSNRGWDGAHNSICYLAEKQIGNRIKVTIRAKNIPEEILGLGFDFEFDPAAAQFLRYEKGGFFERGGIPIYLIKKAGREKIVGGITLKRGDVLQKGSGAIAYFYFHQSGKTQAAFGFKNTIISTLAEGLRKDLENIEWGMCSD